MSFLLPLIISCALGLTIGITLSFIINLQKARSTGLSYATSPITELENIAYLTDFLLRWKYKDYLNRGEGWPHWARFMIKDWMYEDRGRAHREFGEVFLVVSPGGIVCYVGNAKTAASVCTNRNFIKPREKMKMLEPFGPNVVSSDGDLWRLHLRTTVPAFGEGVNRLVWSETQRQTQLLMSTWSNTKDASRKLTDEVFKLTLNVMCTCGFGQDTDPTTDSMKMPSGHSMTLVDGIIGVVEYLAAILLLPKWFLKMIMKHAYVCFLEVEQYTHEFILTEKARLSSDPKKRTTIKESLLTALVKSNANNSDIITDGGDVIAKAKRGRALTDKEVMGNAFIFLLAGYDTTANTIIFCTIVLSLYPQVQDRLIQEIDRVYDEAKKAGRELSYKDDLSKFRYTLAFMYEVMRVFPIVVPIGRMVTENQEISLETKPWASLPTPETLTTEKHVLPKGCGVVVNNTGIHYNRGSWVQPELLDPRRWLSANPNTFDPTAAITEDLDANTHAIPNHAKGSFLAFGEGSRACLGKRFSQVEFVAFFATLLREWRVELEGNVPASEVERTMRLRSGGSLVTLTPPEDVELRLEKRK